MANDTIGTQVLAYRDARGHVGKVKFYITFDGSVVQDAVAVALAVEGQVSALSNATPIKYTGVLDKQFDPASFGTNAAYANCETKLRLAYLCGAAGPPIATTSHRMEIPAPKLADFNVDEETALATAIAPLVTALKAVSGTAYVSNSDGEPVLHGLGGLLIRRKFQRKETIYSKLPDLSGFQL
jgi:hypothetical protein